MSGTLGALLTPEKRRGRPPSSRRPGERDKHLACALLRLLHREREADVARYAGISVRTVRRWTRLALTYDDPRSACLREIHDRAREHRTEPE